MRRLRRLRAPKVIDDWYHVQKGRGTMHGRWLLAYKDLSTAELTISYVRESMAMSAHLPPGWAACDATGMAVVGFPRSDS